MFLFNLFKRQPGLTDDEKAAAQAAREHAARVKRLRLELEAEAEAAADIISNVLAAMNICWRKKDEGKAERTKKVQFKRPFIVNEEAIYLPVDLSPRGRPRGVTVQQLMDEDVLKNLGGEVHRKVTAIFTEADGLFFTIWRNEATRGIPNHVMYDDMLALRPATAGHLAWPLGMTVGKKPIWLNLADFPSMLLLGTSGGGKSNLLNVIIATVSNHCSPRYIRWMLVDFKRLEFSFYYGLPHVLEIEEKKAIVNDAGALVDHLDWLKGEMERRIVLLENAHVKKLSEYNQKRKGPPLPYIYLVVDELAEIMLTPKTGRAAMELLINIAAKGRAVGISMIVCTQYAKSEVVDMRLKANLQGIISFPLPNLNASVAMLGNKAAYEISGIGRCIFQHGHRQLEVQVPLMNNATLETMLTDIVAGKKYTADMSGRDERPRHDVDDVEIVDWSLRENNGDLQRRAIAQKFSGRGLTETLAGQWLQNKRETIVTDSAGQQYAVIPGSGSLPTRLRLIKDDDSDTTNLQPAISPSGDTGGTGSGPAEAAHEIPAGGWGDSSGHAMDHDHPGGAGRGAVVVVEQSAGDA